MKFTGSMFGYHGATLYTEQASQLAQAAFDKWLGEQQVVYGQKNKYGIMEWGQYSDEEMEIETPSLTDTHRARLICIEELAPKVCTHENVGLGRTPAGKSSYLCVDCNKTLKPNWEAV